MLHSMGLQRVGHDRATNTYLHLKTILDIFDGEFLS